MSGPYPTLLPYLEPILASGSVLGRAARPGQAALMLLDAIEPIGVTTQSLDVGGLLTLGTVVTPVGHARLGETVLSVRIKYQNGGDLEVEVAAGSLEVLPLPPSQKAVLDLRPRRNIDVGRGGPGRGGAAVEVQGGLVGLVIDARGRPLALPSDAEKRRERVQQWLWDMGA